MQVRRVVAGLLVMMVGLGVAVVAAPPSSAAFPRPDLGRLELERFHVYAGQRVRISFDVYHEATQTITCGIAWGDGNIREIPPIATVDSTGPRPKTSLCRASHLYTTSPDPMSTFGEQAGVPGGDYFVVVDARDQDGTDARRARRRFAVVCHNERPSAGEEVTGGPENETLCGSPGDNVIRGNAGNDVIYAFDGDDEVDSGGGHDGVVGGSGADIVSGGKGADVAIGFSGIDVLVGENGRDLLFGGAKRDELYGRQSHDFLIDVGGKDHLFAGSGDDLLIACDLAGSGNRPDLVQGATGDDTALVDANDTPGGVEDVDDCTASPAGGPGLRSQPIPRSMLERFQHLR